MIWLLATVALLIIWAVCLLIAVGNRDPKLPEDTDARGREHYLRQRESAREARGGAYLFMVGFTLVWLCVTIGSSIKIVQPGSVMVARSFGTTVERTWTEGFHLVAPWYGTRRYDIRRRMIDMTGEDTISGAALGGVNLEAFDVSFPFEVNPALAWKLYREINAYTPLLEAASRSAGRDTLAQYSWEQIAYGERAEVGLYLTSRFREVVVNDLVTSGFTSEEASQVFTFYPAQIREVTPPQRILQENAELAAAEVALQRQEVLTRIAEQEALRRANEGSGIENLWDELPDASAADIALVLGAIANKTRADAMMRAVEDGDVRVLVLNGQEVAVPTE